MKKSYALIYEDDDIVVVDKSAHVLSIEDRFDSSKPNLKAFLKNRFGEIYVVHRLDLETSGIIIFAKNSQSHALLNEQFRDRRVTKLYHAICRHPLEMQGKIDLSISEHKSKKGVYIAGAKGKSALTTFRVIQSLHPFALVELNLNTGRTHQIRVHMKHIGAPLITDKKYGLSEEFYLSQLKKVRLKKNAEERPLLSRTALHAYFLEIEHPTTGQKKSFTAPLHKDMKAVIYQLEKNSKTKAAFKSGNRI